MCADKIFFGWCWRNESKCNSTIQAFCCRAVNAVEVRSWCTALMPTLRADFHARLLTSSHIKFVSARNRKFPRQRLGACLAALFTRRMTALSQVSTIESHAFCAQRKAKEWCLRLWLGGLYTLLKTFGKLYAFSKSASLYERYSDLAGRCVTAGYLPHKCI